MPRRAAASHMTTHATTSVCHASVDLAGKPFKLTVCCNLLHTNTFQCLQGAMHTQMYLQTSTIMCTHKHLFLPIRIWIYVRTLVWKWFACVPAAKRKLLNWNFRPCWRDKCIYVEPSSRVAVSGRGLIMLPLHCAHTVLSVGWHGFIVGRYGSAKTWPQSEAPAGAQRRKTRVWRAQETFWLQICPNYVLNRLSS